MKIRQLLYFQVVCKHNNITKAAEELRIAQPSISNAIKELENEFGVTLFYRLNKGIKLTKEGAIFLHKANELLKQADSLAQIMTDLGKKRNLIRLGVPPMIGTFLFPKIYKGFKEKYPEVNIVTQEYGTGQLLECLRNDELDIAIIASNNILPHEFRMLPIIQTESLFCVSPKHRLATCKTVSISKIQDEPLVMFSEGFHQSEIVKLRFREAGIVPKIIHYSNQFHTIKEFIVSDIAAGFMFSHIAEVTPNIVGIPLEEPINIQISLAWNINPYIFSDMRDFINHVKNREPL